MDDRFFTAFFPGEAVICGRRLCNFSAYHYTLLKSINSPFLEPGREIAPGDLIVASKALASNFGPTPDMRPLLRDVWWRIKLSRDPVMFRRQCKALALLIESHTSYPKFWDVVHGKNDTRELTAPDIMLVVAALMHKSHVPEADAWNMSLGRAQWLNAVVAEIEGSERRFLDENDLKE